MAVNFHVLLSSGLCTKRDLVAVYCNKHHPERFLVGWIVGCDDNSLLLSLVTPQSKMKGVCLCNTADIFRVVIASQYLCKLQNDSPQNTEFLVKSNSQLFFWEYSKKNSLIVKIRRRSTRQILNGIVIGYNQQAVIIQRIFYNGKSKKTYTIPYSDIVFSTFGTSTGLVLQKKYERRIKNA